jgi:hypothetical protein
LSQRWKSETNNLKAYYFQLSLQLSFNYVSDKLLNPPYT